MAINYRYDPEVYIPAAIRYGYLTEKEARAEYSRLRSIAVKRLQRLASTEGRHHAAFKMYGREGFSPLPRNASASEIGRALADVHHFLEMKTSSISQIREAQRSAVQTLQERGYTFINRSNIREFGEFMEAARRQKVASDNRGGSPIIVELYETVKRLNLDPAVVQRDFAYWLARKKELESMSTPQPGKMVTAEDVRTRLTIREIRAQKKKG